VRLGVVILPEHRWNSARDIWRRAEELRFDHAWTYDHLAWRSLRDTTWFGAIPTLTAAAGVTQRIRLGRWSRPRTFATRSRSPRS
jgi:alkanesulfonate monooxygenase SsuD/methylene tetrahydromethanopterin reductase-like flavin-dependent oxidoreductase (luciferase family)